MCGVTYLLGVYRGLCAMHLSGNGMVSFKCEIVICISIQKISQNFELGGKQDNVLNQVEVTRNGFITVHEVIVP